MANITPAEVRYRLRSISTTAEISDALLNSAAYIPGCESYVNVILANSSLSYSTLSADKQNLVKVAEIALVCLKVVAEAPVEGFDTGIIKSKSVPANDKGTEVAILEKEWRDALEMVGCHIQDVEGTWQVNEGDDYKPDGDDNTNLLWTDTDEETVSIWP